MIAGALLIVGGFLGLALARKQQAAAPVYSPDDDQPNESAEP